MTQFDPSLTSREAPLHPTAFGIAGSGPGGDFCRQRRGLGNPPPQALLAEHAQFDFRHVQPTAIAGRVMDLQAAGQPMGLGRRKSFVERGQMVGVEIITHQLDLARLWIIFIQQLPDLFGPIHPRALLPTADPPPAPHGIKKHKERLHPAALVVIVLGRYLPGLQRTGLIHMIQELHRGLIHCDQGLLRAVACRVEVEDLFHLGHKARGIPFRNAVAFLPPRFENIFFMARRIVSRQMLVTTPRRVSSLASKLKLHRTRPAGGEAQHRATNWASITPSTFGATAGWSRGLRCRAGASPWRTSRLRLSPTVLRWTPKLCAICSSCQRPSGWSSSAINKIRACNIFFAAACPLRVRASSRWRCSEVRTTLNLRICPICPAPAYFHSRGPYPSDWSSAMHSFDVDTVVVCAVRTEQMVQGMYPTNSNSPRSCFDRA